MIHLDADSMLYLGLISAGCYMSTRRNKEEINVEAFRKIYGVQPETASEVFNDIQTEVVGISRVEKPVTSMFFMTIYWPRSYEKEDTVRLRFSVG
jgi:hypothetical protein